jgi:HAD superfamily hydrolase (TIGR01509 family)
MNANPPHIEPPDAVLFDMGGVLQDAAVEWTEANWRRAVPDELARPEPFDWFLDMSRDCIKRFLALKPPRPAMDVRPVIAHWLGLREVDATPQAIDEWFRVMLWWEAQPIYDFVRPTLDRLREMGLRMGVVSNSLMPGDALRRNFDKAGILEHFDAVVFSAEAGVNKPDPRIFDEALGIIGVEANDAWFVGDKPQRDALGAHRAGMTAVLVDSEHVHRMNDGPEYVPEIRIKDISELPDALARPDLLKGSESP